MNWKTKALVLRGLSALPLGALAHYLLQRYATREWPRRPDVLDALLVAARRIRAAAPDAETYLEIGAGRDLAVALALRLLGARQVTCLDVDRLARIDLVQHALSHVAKVLGTTAPAIRSWSDLRRFGVEYVAPARLPGIDLRRAFDCSVPWTLWNTFLRQILLPCFIAHAACFGRMGVRCI